MKSTAVLLDELYSDVASSVGLQVQTVHHHQTEVGCVLQVSVTVNKGIDESASKERIYKTWASYIFLDYCSSLPNKWPREIICKTCTVNEPMLTSNNNDRNQNQ